MSMLRVTAERLVIHPHPNADALELAQVGLYRAVVRKGQFRSGDYAVYIPEQSLLPDDLIEELGLTGRLAGTRKNRVKAIRLRGELSQGIVSRPAALSAVDLEAAAANDEDFADRLGIVKWIPEVPTSMDGEVTPAPDLLPWIDIENIKRYPEVFLPGEPVTATEKVHGTACLLTVTAGGDAWVSSKGYGARNLAIAESGNNVYWQAIRGYDVPTAARKLIERDGYDRVGIYGEVYGAGIQDLTYGVRRNTGKPGYAVFDIRVDRHGELSWLSQDEVTAVTTELGLPMVPRLYEGPFDMAAVLPIANGREQISGTEANIREGVVVRPLLERYSDVLAGRTIIKIVSDGYLMRGGAATEFE
ncbi:MAG TPA: RNA ligase (ATP) [Pseudonocardiaceae bacterium]